MKLIVQNSLKYILDQVMLSLFTRAFTFQENDNPTDVVRKRIMLQYFRKKKYKSDNLYRIKCSTSLKVNLKQNKKLSNVFAHIKISLIFRFA